MNISQRTHRHTPVYFSFALLFSMLFITACDPPEEPIKTGVFELNFQPVVSGQDFVPGETYTNINGRKFLINLFLMYVSDISLVKEDGSELMLSEIELFDIANGGSALRVAHGGNSYKVFKDIEIGNYRGIKFGIGVADRLNTEPANYPVTHPLSVNKGMYWAWRTGYKFMAIEGMVDASPDMNGVELNKEILYHTGKDSINSPNSIYRAVEFVELEHAFTIETDNELQYVIELDINRMFYNEKDTIDMVEEHITHSVPGEGFNLSKRITDNLVNGGLFKVPF